MKLIRLQVKLMKKTKNVNNFFLPFLGIIDFDILSDVFRQKSLKMLISVDKFISYPHFYRHCDSFCGKHHLFGDFNKKVICIYEEVE